MIKKKRAVMSLRICNYNYFKCMGKKKQHLKFKKPDRVSYMTKFSSYNNLDYSFHDVFKFI